MGAWCGGVAWGVVWGRGEGRGYGDESAVSTWCWLRRSAMRGLYIIVSLICATVVKNGIKMCGKLSIEMLREDPDK